MVKQLATDVINGNPITRPATICELWMGYNLAEKWVSERLLLAQTAQEREYLREKLSEIQERRHDFEHALPEKRRQLRKRLEIQESLATVAGEEGLR